MSTDTIQKITDSETARRHLNMLRDGLADASVNLADRTEEFVDLIIEIRPSGLLTVDEIGEAVGRDRNYVDNLWSLHGQTTQGRQTRVPVNHPDPEKAVQAASRLSVAARNLKNATSVVGTVREERNRTIGLVYSAKLLGPSAIAAEVGIDRNHVLRIVRKLGIKPVHRAGARNQYSR